MSKKGISRNKHLKLTAELHTSGELRIPAHCFYEDILARHRITVRVLLSPILYYLYLKRFASQNERSTLQKVFFENHTVIRDKAQILFQIKKFLNPLIQFTNNISQLRRIRTSYPVSNSCFPENGKRFETRQITLSEHKFKDPDRQCQSKHTDDNRLLPTVTGNAFNERFLKSFIERNLFRYYKWKQYNIHGMHDNRQSFCYLIQKFNSNENALKSGIYHIFQDADESCQSQDAPLATQTAHTINQQIRNLYLNQETLQAGKTSAFCGKTSPRIYTGSDLLKRIFGLPEPTSGGLSEMVSNSRWPVSWQKKSAKGTIEQSKTQYLRRLGQRTKTDPEVPETFCINQQIKTIFLYKGQKKIEEKPLNTASMVRPTSLTFFESGLPRQVPKFPLSTVIQYRAHVTQVNFSAKHPFLDYPNYRRHEQGMFHRRSKKSKSVFTGMVPIGGKVKGKRYNPHSNLYAPDQPQIQSGFGGGGATVLMSLPLNKLLKRRGNYHIDPGRVRTEKTFVHKTSFKKGEREQSIFGGSETTILKSRSAKKVLKRHSVQNVIRRIEKTNKTAEFQMSLDKRDSNHVWNQNWFQAGTLGVNSQHFINVSNHYFHTDKQIGQTSHARGVAHRTHSINSLSTSLFAQYSSIIQKSHYQEAPFFLIPQIRGNISKKAIKKTHQLDFTKQKNKWIPTNTLVHKKLQSKVFEQTKVRDHNTSAENDNFPPLSFPDNRVHSNIVEQVQDNNTASLQTEIAFSKEIGEKMVHDYFQKEPHHTINLVADKVYDLLEKRIFIEQDRRGWI